MFEVSVPAFRTSLHRRRGKRVRVFDGVRTEIQVHLVHAVTRAFVVRAVRVLEAGWILAAWEA